MTDQRQMAALELRLKRLESRLHRWRLAMCLAGGLLLGILALGLTDAGAADGAQAEAQAKADKGRTLDDVRAAYDRPVERAMAARAEPREQPERRPVRIVTAEVFAVLDREGRVRSELAAGDQSPCLRMYDAAGALQLELREEGGAMTLRMGPAERTPFVVQSVETGATVWIGGQDGASAPVTLRGGKGRDGAIQLSDRAGATKANLTAHAEDGGTLELVGAVCEGRYRSNGMNASARDGRGVGLALLNGNFAQLWLSASPPRQGQAPVEIGSSGDASWSRVSSVNGSGHVLLRAEGDAGTVHADNVRRAADEARP